MMYFEIVIIFFFPTVVLNMIVKLYCCTVYKLKKLEVYDKDERILPVFSVHWN